MASALDMGGGFLRGFNQNFANVMALELQNRRLKLDEKQIAEDSLYRQGMLNYHNGVLAQSAQDLAFKKQAHADEAPIRDAQTRKWRAGAELDEMTAEQARLKNQVMQGWLKPTERLYEQEATLPAMGEPAQRPFLRDAVSNFMGTSDPMVDETPVKLQQKLFASEYDVNPDVRDAVNKEWFNITPANLQVVDTIDPDGNIRKGMFNPRTGAIQPFGGVKPPYAPKAENDKTGTRTYVDSLGRKYQVQYDKNTNKDVPGTEVQTDYARSKDAQEAFDLNTSKMQNYVTGNYDRKLLKDDPAYAQDALEDIVERFAMLEGKNPDELPPAMKNVYRGSATQMLRDMGSKLEFEKDDPYNMTTWERKSLSEYAMAHKDAKGPDGENARRITKTLTNLENHVAIANSTDQRIMQNQREQSREYIAAANMELKGRAQQARKWAREQRRSKQDTRQKQIEINDFLPKSQAQQILGDEAMNGFIDRIVNPRMPQMPNKFLRNKWID